MDTYFNQTGALVLIDRHLQLILLVIRTGPRTIIIYVILISNKAKTLRLQLMRTYVWNLTDLIDDIRLESLMAKPIFYMTVLHIIENHILYLHSVRTSGTSMRSFLAERTFLQ